MANVVSVIIKGIDQTQDALTAPINGLDDLLKKAAQLKPALMLAATGAVSTLALLTKQSIDTADEMGKLAQKAGVTVETFSGLAHAANLAGVDNNALAVAFKGLSAAMVSAKDGTGETADLFRSLGVEVVKADGTLRNADDVLRDVATRFADTEDGAAKTAAAMKLFGKAGQDLIPLLNSGASGIAEMQTEAKQLGLVFSGETAKSAEEFNDNVTRLKESIVGLGNTLAAGMLPALADVAAETVRIVKEWGIFQATAATLLDVLNGIAAVLITIKDGVNGAAAAAANLSVALIELGKGNIQVAKEALIGYGKAIDETAAKMRSNFTDPLFKNPLTAPQGGTTTQTVKRTFETTGTASPVAELAQDEHIAAWRKAADKEQAEVAKHLEDLNRQYTEATTGKLGLLDAETKAQAAYLNEKITDEAQYQDAIRKLGTIYESEKAAIMAKQIEDEARLAEGQMRQAEEVTEFKRQLLIADADAKALLDEQGLAQFDAQRVREQIAFEEDLERIAELRLAEEESLALSEQAHRNYQTRLTAIQRAEQKQRLALQQTNAVAIQGVFSNLADASRVFGKKGHAAWKAFATSEAIISTYLAATKALASAPPPINYALAAAVTVAGLANVARIQTSEPAGVAHAGLGYVPQEATYILQRGERVLAPTQNEDLTAFLQGGGGGPTVVEVHLDGGKLFEAMGRASRDGRLTIHAGAVV